MNKVSVILTSHNRPDYLEQAINSILNQTLKNVELIIIDDYSTNKNVDKVLEKYSVMDSRVFSFKTEFNLNNIAILWNHGIDIATGEYICLLDDDNVKLPNFCKEMSEWLDNNPDYMAVACFAKIAQKEISNITGTFRMPTELLKNPARILYDNCVDSGCLMFRKSLIYEIGWFDERLKTNEDWDYVKRIQLQTLRGFGVLEKELCVYRWHGKNRLHIRDSLGDRYFREQIVHYKNYSRFFNVLLYHQDIEKITLSQRNVLKGVYYGLKNISNINLEIIPESHLAKFKGLENGYDIIIIYAPFSLNLSYIEMVSKYGKEVVMFHIEDPQAININMSAAKFATSIFTNDISTKKYYEKSLGYGNCNYCPSVSFDDINLEVNNKTDKKYDVVFFGHGYESRIEFMGKLEPLLKRNRIKYLIVGGGWERYKTRNKISEVTQREALKLMSESIFTILKNRLNTDLNGSANSIKPISIVRGYFEIGSDSLVFIDNERQHHSFKNEVIFYKDEKDLISKILYYKKNEVKAQNIIKAAHNRLKNDFTYRTRMNKLINIVRSKRFNVEIS